MSKSALEQVPDRILFAVVKKIFDKIDDMDSLEEVDELSVEYGKIIGLDTILFIDSSYIQEIMRLNQEQFSEGQLTDKLIRPRLNKYIYPASYFEERIIRTDYDVEIETYGSTNSDVVNMKDSLENAGDINIWDYEHGDEEEVDSSTHDYKWYTEGIYKIRN